MNRQGLIKAIRGSECLSKNAPQSLSRRRNFTNSAVCQKNGSIPSFEPTSSPELDQLLARYRYKLFLPAHLSEYDRKIVYNPSKAKGLLAEPQTVEIGGEAFRLEPIDPLNDEPSKRSSFHKVLELMKGKDWNNLPRLLEGLKYCKRPVGDLQLLQMVRKAALQDRMDVIIECARRVAYTGFRLNQPEIVKTVMWGLHYKAANSNWDEAETKQALRWAEMVADMLEDKKHAGGVFVKEGNVRALPEVIGVLLELAAVRASRHLEGKDVDGKVATYAARMVDVPEKKLSVEDGPLQANLDWAMNYWLKEAVPIIHGMKESLQILDPNTRPRNRLMNMLPPLEEKAKRYAAKIRAGTLGAKLYEQVLGSA
ncbi:hypothetical protein ACMFMG_004114 [Clarireedia jacksonii]